MREDGEPLRKILRSFYPIRGCKNPSTITSRVDNEII